MKYLFIFHIVSIHSNLSGYSSVLAQRIAMHAFSSPHVTLLICPTFPHRGIRCLEDTVLVGSLGRLLGISSDGSSPVVKIRSLVARSPGPTPWQYNK